MAKINSELVRDFYDVELWSDAICGKKWLVYLVVSR